MIVGGELRMAFFMQEALKEARKAFDLQEVPIGAVLVLGEEVVARAHNRTLLDSDPTAHSEVLLLREAARKLGNHRLKEAEVFVTVEPCIMCMGALLQARVRGLVFAAYNEKGGACGSVFDFSRHAQLNHHIYEVRGGVLLNEARHLMQDFFRKRRDK